MRFHVCPAWTDLDEATRRGGSSAGVSGALGRGGSGLGGSVLDCEHVHPEALET